MICRSAGEERSVREVEEKRGHCVRGCGIAWIGQVGLESGIGVSVRNRPFSLLVDYGINIFRSPGQAKNLGLEMTLVAVYPDSSNSLPHQKVPNRPRASHAGKENIGSRAVAIDDRTKHQIA